MTNTERFMAAIEEIKRGRSFIPIHEIRSCLNWKRSRFDKSIMELAKSHTIQLTGGDPSHLTRKQVNDAFMDSKGRLRLLLLLVDIVSEKSNVEFAS